MHEWLTNTIPGIVTQWIIGIFLGLIIGAVLIGISEIFRYTIEKIIEKLRCYYAAKQSESRGR